MREIKFRALSFNSMVYPNGNITSGDILKRFSTVMQYTGLRDRNGIEIYEGDLIRYSNTEESGDGEITFSAGFNIRWDLSTVNTKTPMLTSPLFYFQCSSELEVIGNIHETTD